MDFSMRYSMWPDLACSRSLPSGAGPALTRSELKFDAFTKMLLVGKFWIPSIVKPDENPS